jgi:hypothetical protein
MDIDDNVIKQENSQLRQKQARQKRLIRLKNDKITIFHQVNQITGEEFSKDFLKQI